jgi:putative oxidoreductase
MAKSKATQELGILLIRVSAGLMMFLLHGWGKLGGAWGHLAKGSEWGFVGGVASIGFPFPLVFALASTLAESLGALLVALGWWSRPAAAVVAFNMAVAVYRHLTTDMRYELALIYLVIFLAFTMIPAGRFSLDARLRDRR